MAPTAATILFGSSTGNVLVSATGLSGICASSPSIGGKGSPARLRRRRRRRPMSTTEGGATGILSRQKSTLYSSIRETVLIGLSAELAARRRRRRRPEIDVS